MGKLLFATAFIDNLDVDDRGYIYAVDRADTGLHIVEFKP